MEVVVGLLLMLLRVSHGVETHCDGRQDGILCYGALGGTLILQLMDDASEIPRYEWKNETTIILKGQKSKIIRNNIRGRSSFTPSTGTFKINNLNRNDGTNYTLTLYDKDNKVSGNRTLTLSIQAPVTSVKLTSDCLSLGEKRTSCSAEGGDRPQYRWTLDGRTLTDDELLNGTSETKTVTLKLQVLGQLVCWAHNHVSNVSKSMELPTCGFIFINCTLSNGTDVSGWVHEASNTLCVPPTTVSTTSVGILPILAGVLAALVILIVVALAITRFQKKKQHNKTKEEDDSEELTYADVRIVQQRERRVEPDMAVEYGQVKFSARPRQTEARGDDCVYSQVRQAR